MRVHIGSDHAGLELKDHLLAWLDRARPRARRPRPVRLRRARRLPGLLPARGRGGVAADQAAGIEALGVVVGGSGNGEQIAANKVRGVRSALAWSEETAALAREHNDANVVSVGGRMHSLDDMTRFVEIFLATPFSGDERHVRRIGMLADYETTGELPPLPERRSARPAAMPEGHTLRRLADELTDAFAGRRVRVSSPAGPVRRRRRAARRLGARSGPTPRASTSSSSSSTSTSCTSTSA